MGRTGRTCFLLPPLPVTTVKCRLKNIRTPCSSLSGWKFVCGGEMLYGFRDQFFFLRGRRTDMIWTKKTTRYKTWASSPSFSPIFFVLFFFPPNIFGGLHDSTKLGAYGEMHPFPHPNDDASDSFLLLLLWWNATFVHLYCCCCGCSAAIGINYQ